MGIKYKDLPEHVKARLTPPGADRRKALAKAAEYSAWVEKMAEGPGIFFARKLLSLANERLHHMDLHKKKQAVAKLVGLFLLAKRPTIPADGLIRVKLTRYGPKLCDSHDNLRSAFKPVVDAIAKYAGVDDGSQRWRFEYAQEQTPHHGFRVEIGDSNASN